MKNFLLICIASLFLFACQSKNDKVQDFVKMYNRSSEMMKIPKIRSTKATSSNSEEVDIEINTSYQTGNTESSLLGSALPEMMGQIIKSEPLGKELLEAGVKFNLKIYGADFTVITNKTIDKTTLNDKINLESIAKGNTPNSSDLNEILKIFNKNLPMEDKASGTTIVSITADESNNIIYTTEVPESFKILLENEGSEQLLKDEMLRSPQVQQIFTKTSVLGVNNIKYKYIDKKGNTIKEVTISKNDIK